MRTVMMVLMLAGISLLVAACERGPSPAPAGSADGVAVAATHAGHSAGAHGQAATTGTTGTTGTTATTGTHAHARAGEGEGLPLLPIMQKLGSDMMLLTHGLMLDDQALVAEHAEAIAHHAPIAAEEVARIHAVLGSDMAQFEQIDEQVHVASVHLHEAAVAGDTNEVLTRLNEVQRGCVACHAKFRERLRGNGVQ